MDREIGMTMVAMMAADIGSGGAGTEKPNETDAIASSVKTVQDVMSCYAALKSDAMGVVAYAKMIEAEIVAIHRGPGTLASKTSALLGLIPLHAILTRCAIPGGDQPLHG